MMLLGFGVNGLMTPPTISLWMIPIGSAHLYNNTAQVRYIVFAIGSTVHT